MNKNKNDRPKNYFYHHLFQIILVTSLFTITNRGNASDCFKEHLKEAITQNESRATLYQNLTNNESKKISKRLIGFEKFLLFLTHFSDPDKKGRSYEESGINITCDLFISMRETPPFQNESPYHPTIESFISIDADLLSREIFRAHRKNGMEGVAKVAIKTLKLLSREPYLNCMTRHILESIAHTALLAPKHVSAAHDLSLPSPLAIHKQLVKGQTWLLKDAVNLDEEALPIQVMGVPIICQDVPKILDLSTIESDQIEQ